MLKDDFLMTKLVLDTNILIDMFQDEDMTFELLLKALKLAFLNKDIKELIILDSVYCEVEKLKKGNSCCSKIAMRVYRKIGEAIKNCDLVSFYDVNRNFSGVDESIINFCIETNCLLVSFDMRINIRYNHKVGKDKFDYLELNYLRKIVKLLKKLEYLSEDTLYNYLQIIFKFKLITPIEYIQLSENERFEKLIDFITDNTLKDKNEELVADIKKEIKSTYKINITNNVLNRNLLKLKNLNFGEIKIKKVSLKEKFKDIIGKFLIENKIESFDELQKKYPFKKEEEIVQAILIKYKIEVNENKQKNFRINN